MKLKRWRAHYLNTGSESDRAKLESCLRAAEAAIRGQIIPYDAESEEAVMNKALSGLRLLKSE